MKIFLLKLLAFVRPYRIRFFLGLVCGFLYGPGERRVWLAVTVRSWTCSSTAPPISTESWRLLAPAHRSSPLTVRLCHVASGIDRAGRLASGVGSFMFSIIPTRHVLFGYSGYLNVYLTNWAAARAVADIRRKLFEPFAEPVLEFLQPRQAPAI